MPELEQGSPQWWLKKLGDELNARAASFAHYENYYEGDHTLKMAGDKFRQAFGSRFPAFADNFCELVVDAVEERLNVDGFRFGDAQGDKEAWAIWQANNLDAESQVAHVEALVKSRSFALVWADDSGFPQITVEDPLQMVIAFDPANRRRKLAALKRWHDESGHLFATVYLPDALYKFRSRSTVDTTTVLTLQTVAWEEREEVLPNPLGVVPVVALVNKPRLTHLGRSEIATVIPLQDTINKLLADMVVASEFGAFRQRWAVGIEIPKDPETGQPIEPLKAAVDRLWTSKNADAKFGEFEQTNLQPFVQGIEMLIQHVASITRTPAHYLLGNTGTFPSGESLKATETGLVAKARRKMRHFGESWEEVMRLAFRIIDSEKAFAMDAETLWKDPESRTESQHADSVVKQKAIGVPDEILWEELGYSPQKIARIKEIRAEQPQEVPEQPM